MKKLITLILAIVMTASIFAACSGNTPAATTEKPSESTPGDTNASTPVETPTICPPPGPPLGFDLDDLDYDGKDVYVFHWGNAYPEFTPDENANEEDPISEAVYTRNLRVEEGLGIKLNFASENEFTTSYDTFVTKLEKRIQDPETTVDIIAAYSRTAPNVLINGFYTDLNAYEDIDLTKHWWPGNVREAYEIKGKLYFATGDLSMRSVTELEALFMNVNMFKNLGNDYDKFIKDVLNGKWTLDDLIALCKGTYMDLDNVPGESNGDSFGIIGDSNHFSNGMWAGMGYKLFEISEEDDSVYEISEDVFGDNAANFVKKLKELSEGVDAHIQLEQQNETMTLPDKMASFTAGKAMFMAIPLGDFDADAVDTEYVALPYPKASETQEQYHTAIGNMYSLFGICSSAEDKVLSARILETWGYYGSCYTTDAVYVETYPNKWLRNDDSLHAFDIIRRSVTYDPGRAYERYTGTLLSSLISRTLVNGSEWSATLTKAKKDVLNSSLAESNKNLLDVINGEN